MPKQLSKYPVHLGLGATAVSEPAFTGDMQWYADYVERHASDGTEARLVSYGSFDEPWTMWEMHPRGAEVVLCVSGTMTLIQELEGKPVPTVLHPGEYAINEPGVWHTADVDGPATAVFITAGQGTQHRPR